MTRSSGARLLTAGALALAVAWLVPAPAAGQALYGSIVGNVTDAQGASVPGVVLTASNTGTGLKVGTTSDATGAYAFRNLLPGPYDLTASLSGFREHNRRRTRSRSSRSRWGAPVTGITSLDFMRFTPGSEFGTPRTVQIGVRVQF